MAEETEKPESSITIEGIEDIDPVKLWDDIGTWFTEYLWNTNTAYQGIIILGSFFLGYFLYRMACGHVDDAITKRDMPSRAKRVLLNLRKLLFPLLTLISIFVSTRIAESDLVGMNVYLTEGMMKVLLAWIAIRVAVQFIENNAVRNIFALTIWSVAALSIFGVLDQTTATLDAIGFNIGDFRLSALAVIKGILSLFLLLYMAVFLSSFLERRVLKAKSLTRSSQVLISKIVRVILIVFALLIGLTSSGIDLSLFAVFGGAIGLGIGFGLQKGISNLFSGMLLLVDRSIQPGDVIELENGTFGWVQQMAARYTEIVTRDNKSFLIPNEEFITQRVVNWSHGDTLIRLEVCFGVHYNSDPHDVKRLAEIAAATPERVCGDPTPVCHLVEFGDSSLNFKLRFWIKDAEKGVTNMRGAVMLALWDSFKEHGIEIPYPHREVYLHDVTA